MTRCQWPDCPVETPRRRCYFHAGTPTKPMQVAPTPLEHVRSHLRPQDRPYLDLLLRPLTLDEIAAERGTTRRLVEDRWWSIASDAGLSVGRPGTHGTLRLALARMALGIDPCWCA